MKKNKKKVILELEKDSFIFFFNVICYILIIVNGGFYGTWRNEKTFFRF